MKHPPQYGATLPRPARAGVTLLEMLIVVTIVAVMAGVSLPAITAGLSSVRLSSASGSVASFLTASMNQVDRREQPAAVQIAPTNLSLFTAASGANPERTLALPQGIAIEGPFENDAPRRYILQPGGTVPRIALILRNDKGARRSVQIDPTTGVPDIRRVESQ